MDRPEIGSDAWAAAQAALGLPPEEIDRPEETSLRPRPGESAQQTLDRVIAAVREEQA